METAPSYRNNAIWAGIFFIIATAFLFIGEAFYGPALSDPEVLSRAAAAENDIALGVLIEFACVLAIPLIAVALYPVLRRVSATLAIGYVAFRLFEAAVFFQMEADKLTVSYDPTYGFPSDINIDQVKAAMDDELHLTASNFEVLK